MITSLKSFGINRLCHLFSVSESAYYATLRQKKQRKLKHLGLQMAVKTLFTASRESAGSRTSKTQLNHSGMKAGRYLIRKMMKMQGLVCKQTPKYRYVDKSERQPFENLLTRRFQKSHVANALCGDFTYLLINGKWHYLAVVLELATRRLVEWHLSTNSDAELVKQALRQAMLRVEPTDGMLFHSDQGSVYGKNPL